MVFMAFFSHTVEPPMLSVASWRSITCDIDLPD